MKGDALKSGNTGSCGYLHRDRTINYNISTKTKYNKACNKAENFEYEEYKYRQIENMKEFLFGNQTLMGRCQLWNMFINMKIMIVQLYTLV